MIPFAHSDSERGLVKWFPGVYLVKCRGPFTPVSGWTRAHFWRTRARPVLPSRKKREKKKAPAFPQGPFSKTEMWVQCFIVSFRGDHLAAFSLFVHKKAPAPFSTGAFECDRLPARDGWTRRPVRRAPAFPPGRESRAFRNPAYWPCRKWPARRRAPCPGTPACRSCPRSPPTCRWR